MAKAKDTKVGCGVCGRKLPPAQFGKCAHKAADIQLANMWINLPCLDCIEAAKKDVLKRIKETTIEDGFVVHKLETQNIGPSYDTCKVTISSMTYTGKKL